MSENIICFATAKSKAEKEKTSLLGTFDIYVGADGIFSSAGVNNSGHRYTDTKWLYVASRAFRDFAWNLDVSATKNFGERGRPILNITAYENGHIETRWASEQILTKQHIDSVKASINRELYEVSTFLTV